MGRVTEQKTFKEAFKMAEDYVHEVFERCSSLNSSSGQKQAVLAMEYIRQHYNEPELGLRYLLLSEYWYKLFQYYF